MLEIKNLNKSFGNNHVLKDVSLVATRGSIICIRGESGGGKTTFLRCIANLEDADSGIISIDGINMREYNKNILNADKYAEKVGLVFQEYNLFPHLNVLENLILAPTSQKSMNQVEAENKAIEILTKLGINDKLKEYPYQLSGGQKQRVAIARSCMLNPSILCFDEPTSALDEKSSNEIVKIIKSLAKDGMCILVISHDYAFCDKLGNNQYEMIDGSLLSKTNL